jgi:hypothetical protein
MRMLTQFRTAFRGCAARGPAVLGICLLLVPAAGAAPAVAESAACTYGLYRAGAHNSLTNQDDLDINGVKGVVDIPLTYNFRNVDSGTDFSTADLYASHDGDFVQFGWNYGYTNGVHGFEAVIRPFMGEAIGIGEQLQFHFSITLTPGTSHLFELRRSEDSASPDYGKWFGFIDGVARLKTLNAHTEGYAGTTGEVNRLCHGLRNSVVDQTANGTLIATLKARRRSTGAWYQWAEQFDSSNDPCIVATRYVDASANDYSTFAPSCPQN